MDEVTELGTGTPAPLVELSLKLPQSSWESACAATATLNFREAGARHDICLQMAVDRGNGGMRTRQTARWNASQAVPNNATELMDPRMQGSVAFLPFQTA